MKSNNYHDLLKPAFNRRPIFHRMQPKFISGPLENFQGPIGSIWTTLGTSDVDKYFFLIY